MQDLLSLATGLTPILQIVLTVVLAIIFWEPIAQRIGWKPKEEAMESTPAWASQLTLHYNHETTDALIGIRETQEKTNDLVRDHNRLDERVIILLEEIQKYGVKCRKE